MVGFLLRFPFRQEKRMVVESFPPVLETPKAWWNDFPANWNWERLGGWFGSQQWPASPYLMDDQHFPQSDGHQLGINPPWHQAPVTHFWTPLAHLWHHIEAQKFMFYQSALKRSALPCVQAPICLVVKWFIPGVCIPHVTSGSLHTTGMHVQVLNFPNFFVIWEWTSAISCERQRPAKASQHRVWVARSPLINFWASKWAPWSIHKD